MLLYCVNHSSRFELSRSVEHCSLETTTSRNHYITNVMEVRDIRFDRLKKVLINKTNKIKKLLDMHALSNLRVNVKS